MRERFYRILDEYMLAFSKWFASSMGVLETCVLIFAWVIIEQIFPKIDPNGFMLLYVLTIWSGATQNILAYASNVSAIEAQKNQDLLVQLAKNNIDMMEAILSLMENQERMLNKFNQILGNIAEDVEQIQDEIVEE